MGQFKLARSGRLLAAVALVAPMAALGATAAQADPGTCGVRSDGPIRVGDRYSYVVRNRCSTTVRFKVYLPTFGKYAFHSPDDATCASIPGGGDNRGYWWWVHPDQYWSVSVC